MSLLSQRHEVAEFKKSYRWMALFAIGAFAALGARLTQLQALQHDMWRERAQNNITKTVRLAPTRGVITDKNGELIADNRPAYKVLATPKWFEADRDTPKLARLLNLSSQQQQQLRSMTDGLNEVQRAQQVELFDEITREQLAALETHLHEFPALDIVTDPVRAYPNGSLGVHAIGYLNEVNAEDIEDDEHYRVGDRIGRSGLEKRYERKLRGERGFMRALVDATGEHPARVRDSLLTAETFKEPVPGHSLALTLDMALMRRIDEAFSPYPAGAAVVVEVNTGKLAAVYSKPAYDPNELTGGISKDRYASMLEDPFRPLIDRTVFETYFPGSTFKPITAFAGLETGQANHQVECRGSYKLGRQRFGCNGRHDEVGLHKALVRSCNVYFWKMSEEIGLDAINQFASLFGFGQKTGVGFGAESAGFLASRQWYKEHYGAYRPGYTLNTAIGQGNTRATPLQVALMYAAIANGGTLYRPIIVESVTAPDGTVVASGDPDVRRKIALRPEHLARVQRALVDVVADKKGTAYGARVRGGVSVAGKTGTAEVIGRAEGGTSRAWYMNRSHGWFAGYAPAIDPQFAIAVVIEHGGSGSKSAAPIGVGVLSHHLEAR